LPIRDFVFGKARTGNREDTHGKPWRAGAEPMNGVIRIA
jgi:hypothetical protein